MADVKLVNENKIGLTKGTALEDAAGKEFKGETWEVGVYLAMARQAEAEGYGEISAALKTIAWEEAGHASRFAALNGMLSTSTRENLEKMLAGEQMANAGKHEAALKATELGVAEANAVFDETSRDEGRHARTLAGLLARYFGA